jgi:hypothetical protein
MAFLKTARAQIVNPQLQGAEWNNIRTASSEGGLGSSLRKQAEDILGEPLTPSRYLLTHATIVCSVDAVSAPGMKTGAVEEDGQEINRKYANFRVAPKTDKYINNNLDSWSREVIQRSYKTFIGAHNFVEHVQVEELSKGRIIDAVLRDIGESLYVDILVATDRKHKDLVDQIVSGQMNSMSMGCSVDFTICTKCGHVAADETEMCRHIKYEKGNVFYDDQGNKHRVAELCGHHDDGETAGVTFIEASWVETPAFKGAVARNILDLPEDTKKTASLRSLPEEWSTLKGGQKNHPFSRLGFGFGDDDDEGSDDKKEEAPKSILDQIEESITQAVIDRVKSKIEKEILSSKIREKLDPPIAESTVHENDNIIKEGYFNRLKSAVELSGSEAEAVYNVALVNKHYGVELSHDIYALASRLGDIKRFASLQSYMDKATKLSSKELSSEDFVKLIKLSKIISSRA